MFRPPLRRLDGRDLRCEPYESRSRQRLREAGEHGEVGVKRDLGQPANAKRCEAVEVLERSELALNRCASRARPP